MFFSLKSKNWRGPEKAVKEWRVEAAQQAAAGLEAVVFWSEAKATIGPLEELAEATRRKLADLESEQAGRNKKIEKAEAKRRLLIVKSYSKDAEGADLQKIHDATALIENTQTGLGALGKKILDTRADLQGMEATLDLLRAVKMPPADVLPGLAEWLSLSR